MKKKNSTVLEVRGLSIRRGSTHILRELNWRIEPGDHWVILGSNGSGKTSLLSSLLGYFTPTAGSIALFGQEYGQSDWRKLRLKIGIVSSALRQMMPEHEPACITVASGKHAMIDFWGEPKKAEMKR
ncbi:MAG: ATP-binding cassette domain-containing protein, partial [Verrucomicrobiales bacterium]